ncbi:MAG: MFS transporter [Chlamydiota bacterium]
MFSQIEPLLPESHPLRKWIVFLSLTMATTLAFLTSNTTVILQSVITKNLAIDGGLSSWITTLYLLGTNSLVPVGNRIADRIGYKQTFCIGNLLFTIGTIGVVLSKSFLFLAGSRLLEGVGAGMIFPTCLAILVREFPKERLTLVLNLYLGISIIIGFGFGGIFSGYCGAYLLWQMAFIALIPICLLTFFLGLFFQRETEKVDRGPFDYWGFLLFISGMFFMLVALSDGNLPSTAEGWRAPYIQACLGSFLICLIGMIWIESLTENPVVPLRIFRYAPFTLGCITLFTLGMIAFSSVNFSVYYLERGLLYDHFMVGRTVCFYGVPFGIGSLAGSYLMKKLTAKYLSLIGLGLLVASLLLNNVLTIQSGENTIRLLLILRGTALGVSVGPVTTAALQSLPKHLSSDGATFVTFFRQLGATFGGSVLGIVAIRRNVYHRQLFMEPVQRSLSGYQESLFRLKQSVFAANPRQAALRAQEEIIDYIYRQAYIQSLNDALMLFGYIIGGVLCILSVIHLKDSYKRWHKKTYVDKETPIR